MAEYIEREALLNNRPEGRNPIQTGKQEYNLGWNDCRHTFVECILGEPAADVAPVVHGRWLPSESDFDDDDTLFDVEDWRDWQCSACHTDICYEDPMERRFLPKFCPNCGARMDGE